MLNILRNLIEYILAIPGRPSMGCKSKNSDVVFPFINILISAWVLKDAASTMINPGRYLFSETLNQAPYLTIRRVRGFSHCIEYCDARVKCKSVTYWRVKDVCELHVSAMPGDAGSPTQTRTQKTAVLFESDSWQTKIGQCGKNTCSEDQSCNLTSPEQCAVRECEEPGDPVTSNYSHILGNMQRSGARIVRRCNRGLVFPDSTLQTQFTCASNGSWVGGKLDECEPATCKHFGVANSHPIEFESYDLTSGELIKIYCIFGSDHGYTYISRDYWKNVTDLTRFYTRTDHVMLRHRRNDDTQWEGKFSELPRYKSKYNLSLLINDNTGFARSGGLKADGYMLAGLVPLSDGVQQGSIRGYTFEDSFRERTVCDANPTNHFVVAASKPAPYDVDRCDVVNNDGFYATPMSCMWVNEAYRTFEELPDEYFYWYGMFMGGCGPAFTELRHSTFNVTGAAIGLRFDL